MDMPAANLIEVGDKALVVNTGYFSDRFVAVLERYGAQVTQVRAPTIGDAPPLEEVEAALKGEGHKLLAVTHVDTSTGVGTDIKGLAALGREHGALVVVDGVCSVAGEEMRQEAWGIDVALTASQKAIGVPPGLSPVVADLDALVDEGRIERYEFTGRTLRLYVSGLANGFVYHYQYRLRADYPVDVLVPSSQVYDYYTPNRQDITPPQRIKVTLSVP